MQVSIQYRTRPEEILLSLFTNILPLSNYCEQLKTIEEKLKLSVMERDELRIKYWRVLLISQGLYPVLTTLW